MLYCNKMKCACTCKRGTVLSRTYENPSQALLADSSTPQYQMRGNVTRPPRIQHRALQPFRSIWCLRSFQSKHWSPPGQVNVCARSCAVLKGRGPVPGDLWSMKGRMRVIPGHTQWTLDICTGAMITWFQDRPATSGETNLRWHVEDLCSSTRVFCGWYLEVAKAGGGGGVLKIFVARGIMTGGAKGIFRTGSRCRDMSPCECQALILPSWARLLSFMLVLYIVWFSTRKLCPGHPEARTDGLTRKYLESLARSLLPVHL